MRLFLTALFLLATFSSAHAQIGFWQSQGWQTDFTQMSVDPSEIFSGGPPKDGIPPIDNPAFAPVSEATDLTDRDPVIGLEINGDARAYPLRILIWHEIVNDTVGGMPVAVTFCPLCNSAIVFDATLDGEVHSFGTTGKLRNSDLVMYDRPTESWWQQFTGRAIAGTYTDRKLTMLPSRLEGWADFKARHPDGKVLVPNNPAFRAYGRNPYVSYDIAARPFLFKGELPKDIPAMARVIVVRESEAATDTPKLIVAMETVRIQGAFEKNGVTLTWQEGQASALHTEAIAEGRDVGTITVRPTDGAASTPLTKDVTFAFVAHAFYPDIAIEQ
ncbi:MAG: DUF3179 domain-containing protein [Pseudomonadota bacterium]